MRRCGAAYPLACLLAVVQGALAAPHGKGTSAEALQLIARISEAPVIDGQLDDAVWATVPVQDAFVQARPVPGAAPSRRTTLRLATDGRTLFIALSAFDDEPQHIVARSLARDALGSDDQMVIVIDTQGRGRTGFWFAVNARGTQADARITDGTQLRPEWNAQWESAAVIDAQGWTAELAIPLRLLELPAPTHPVDAASWLLNTERLVAHANERMLLHGATSDRGVQSLDDAGRIAGAPADADQPALRLRPSLRYVSLQKIGQPDQARWQPALDAIWRVRPGMTAALTLNSPLTEGSIAKQPLNLGRFELFQAETRTFFTADAGRFSFGGLSEDEPKLLPFFTRRIGIDADGNGRSLDVGLRLAGNAAPLDFGVLATQVAADANGVAPRAYALRAATDVSPTVRLGVIATEGNPQGSSGSSLGGVDAQLRRTDVWGDKTLQAAVWALRSANAVVGRGRATGGQIDYPNMGWNGSVQWLRIDQNFIPALGFVEEAGVQRANGEFGWKQLLADGAEVAAAIEWSRRRRLDGRERSAGIGPSVTFSNVKGDTVEIGVGASSELLAAGFTPAPGIAVQPGSYRDRSASFEVQSSDRRPLVASASLATAGFYGGLRQDQSLGLSWRPDAHWSASFSGQRHRLQLAGTRFTVRSAALSVEHASSVDASQSASVQWDNVSREIGIGLRARWKVLPNAELEAALDRLAPADKPGSPLRAVAVVRLVWDWER